MSEGQEDAEQGQAVPYPMPTDEQRRAAIPLVALYDYEPTLEDKSDIGLVEGKEVYGIELQGEWWWGFNDERAGIFPANYVAAPPPPAEDAEIDEEEEEEGVLPAPDRQSREEAASAGGCSEDGDEEAAHESEGGAGEEEAEAEVGDEAKMPPAVASSHVVRLAADSCESDEDEEVPPPSPGRRRKRGAVEPGCGGDGGGEQGPPLPPRNAEEGSTLDADPQPEPDPDHLDPGPGPGLGTHPDAESEPEPERPGRAGVPRQDARQEEEEEDDEESDDDDEDGPDPFAEDEDDDDDVDEILTQAPARKTSSASSSSSSSAASSSSSSSAAAATATIARIPGLDLQWVFRDNLRCSVTCYMWRGKLAPYVVTKLLLTDNFLVEAAYFTPDLPELTVFPLYKLFADPNQKLQGAFLKRGYLKLRSQYYFCNLSTTANGGGHCVLTHKLRERMYTYGKQSNVKGAKEGAAFLQQVLAQIVKHKKQHMERFVEHIRTLPGYEQLYNPKPPHFDLQITDLVFTDEIGDQVADALIHYDEFKHTLK